MIAVGGDFEVVQSLIGRSSKDVCEFLKELVTAGGLTSLSAEARLNMLRLLVADAIYDRHPIDELLVSFLLTAPRIVPPCSQRGLEIILAQTALNKWLETSRSVPGQGMADRRLAAVGALQVVAVQQQRESDQAASLARKMMSRGGVACGGVAGKSGNVQVLSTSVAPESDVSTPWLFQWGSHHGSLDAAALATILRATQATALLAQCRECASIRQDEELVSDPQAVHQRADSSRQMEGPAGPLPPAKRSKVVDSSTAARGAEQAGSAHVLEEKTTAAAVVAAAETAPISSATGQVIAPAVQSAASLLLQACSAFALANLRSGLSSNDANTDNGASTVSARQLQSIAANAAQLLTSACDLPNAADQTRCCLRLCLWRCPDEVLLSCAEALTANSPCRTPPLFALCASALLPRVRTLRQGASRTLLRAIEAVCKRCPAAVVQGVLSRCMRLPGTAPWLVDLLAEVEAQAVVEGASRRAAAAGTKNSSVMALVPGVWQLELVSRAFRQMLSGEDKEFLLQSLCAGTRGGGGGEARVQGLGVGDERGQMGVDAGAYAAFAMAGKGAGSGPSQRELGVVDVCDAVLSIVLASSGGGTIGGGAKGASGAAGLSVRGEETLWTALVSRGGHGLALGLALGSLSGWSTTAPDNPAGAGTGDVLKAIHSLLTCCTSLQSPTVAALLGLLEALPASGVRQEQGQDQAKWLCTLVSTLASRHGAVLLEVGLVSSARRLLQNCGASILARSALAALDRL